MQAESILNIAQNNQTKAFSIIKELKIVEAWALYGGKANLVGSLRTGLLMKNLDIDFHIYSDPFSIKDSFGAIAHISTDQRIKKVSYINLLDTPEKCIEWHLWYQDDNNRSWKIDMIHILNTSKYVGYFELVADKINAVLTPEYKSIILSIKNDIPDDMNVMGIEIYQAVIRDNVKNYSEFIVWKRSNNQSGVIEWMPLFTGF